MNKSWRIGDRRISGRSVTVLRLLVFTLALAQIADIVTTNRDLATSATTREVNPIMLLSMRELGSLWWLPKLALAVFLVILGLRMKRPLARTAVFASVVAIIFIAVLINNAVR